MVSKNEVMKKNVSAMKTFKLRLKMTVVTNRKVRIVMTNETVLAPDKSAIVLTPEMVKIFCERNSEYSPTAYIIVKIRSAKILSGTSGENNPNPKVKRKGRMKTCGEKCSFKSL